MTLRLKLVDRLVAHAVLSAVAMSWVVLVGFDVFRAFVGQTGDIGKGGYALSTAVGYVLLTVPRRGFEMFIYAALIGSLLGLGTLAASGELTALRAAGLSRLRIGVSAVLALALMTVVVTIIGETAAPAGEQRAQALAVQAKSDAISLARESGLWARDGETVINAKQGTTRETAQGRIVHLADVRVFEFTERGQLRSIAIAGSAEHSAGHWLMRDVRRTRFEGFAAVTTTESVAEWKSGLDPRYLALSIVQPEYLSLRDLRRSIAYLQRNRQDSEELERHYWARLFLPFNILLLAMCTVPFAFGALRSGGLGKRIFLGIVMAIGWYFLQRAVVSIGAVYGVPFAVANLAPGLIVAALAALYFRRRV